MLGTIDGVQSPQVGLVPGQPPTVVDGQVLVQATLVAPADSAEAEVDGRDDPYPSRRGRHRGPRRRQHRRQPGRPAGQRARPQGHHPGDPRRSSSWSCCCCCARSRRPLVLVAANVLSFAATIGVSALVFNHVFDFPGSDPSTPLYGFVFLVALGHRLLDLPHDAGTRGVPDPGYPAGHPRRPRGHRRRHHQRGHRSRVDVLGPGGAADPLPRPDRLHRRVRRPARHLRGALPARPRPLLRPRRPDLVAVRPASSRGARGGAAEGRPPRGGDRRGRGRGPHRRPATARRAADGASAATDGASAVETGRGRNRIVVDSRPQRVCYRPRSRSGPAPRVVPEPGDTRRVGRAQTVAPGYRVGTQAISGGRRWSDARGAARRSVFSRTARPRRWSRSG